MLELLREVEKIAGTVSPEVLRNVAAQIQVLVAPRTSVDPHSTLETSPMAPHRLAHQQGDSRELLNSADGAASAASGQQSTDGSSTPGDSDDSENMDYLGSGQIRWAQRTECGCRGVYCTVCVSSSRTRVVMLLNVITVSCVRSRAITLDSAQWRSRACAIREGRAVCIDCT